MAGEGVRRSTFTIGTAALALLAAACGGAGGSGGDEDKSINVLMVGNPQMEDIQKLTAEGFTKESGIKVNFTILARERASR